MKINKTVLLTGWKLSTTNTFSLNNTGVVFLNVKLPQSRRVSKMVKNLSVIDYDAIKNDSPVITFFNAFEAIVNGVAPPTSTGHYILQGVKITEISSLFNFSDQNGEELNEAIDGVMDSLGQVRKLDAKKDSVNYRLRVKLADIENSSRFIYATGFQEAGQDLFNMPAKNFYYQLLRMNLSESDVANQLSNHGLDVLVSKYITKEKQQLRWTFQGVKGTYKIINDCN